MGQNQEILKANKPHWENASSIKAMEAVRATKEKKRKEKEDEQARELHKYRHTAPKRTRQ